MKWSLSLIATIAGLGLAGSAYALEPADQAGQASDPWTARSSPASDALNTRLAAVVPAGMSATEACAGFKSTAECAATLHASQNLGLSFAELKSKVTGGQTLGAAIKDLKPEANVKAEVRKAEQQARADSPPPQG